MSGRFEGLPPATADEARHLFGPSDPLEEGIAGAVLILQAYGVETYQSCEGGEGHSYPQPTVDFEGEFPEGFRALWVATTYGLPVRDIGRTWIVNPNSEPEGPIWRITFWRNVPITSHIFDTFCDRLYPLAGSLKEGRRG